MGGIVSIDGPVRTLPAALSVRVADKVRQQETFRFVSADDVDEVVAGGHLIDKGAEQAIRDELREYGIEVAS